MSLDIGFIIVTVVGFIIWLVRLEGRVNSNEKITNILSNDVKTLTVKHEALDSKTINQLMEVKESLARIEGALGVKK